MQRGRLLADGPPREILDRLGGARAIRVRLVGGAQRTITVTGEEHQQDLLKRLVEDGLPVVEFTHVDAGLEALFLRLTEDPDEPGDADAAALQAVADAAAGAPTSRRRWRPRRKEQPPVEQEEAG
jgi:hypothetical protein